MRIVVSADGDNLDAPVSPTFGRCPVFLFVDVESLVYEAVPNPGRLAAGGAGIQAAQFVIGHGPQAVLSDNVGPNAFRVLQAAGLPIYQVRTGTVREAIEKFRAGQLEKMQVPTAGRGPGRAGPRGRPF